jgi:hypothetical protein
MATLLISDKDANRNASEIADSELNPKRNIIYITELSTLFISNINYHSGFVPCKNLKYKKKITHKDETQMS